MRKVALAAWMVSLGVLGVPSGVAQDEDECAGGVDAGDNFESATVIESPADCAGTVITAVDPYDWYKFEVPLPDVSSQLSVTVCNHAAAGLTMRVEVWYIDLLVVVVDGQAKKKAEFVVDAGACNGTTQVTEPALPVQADWRVHVLGPFGGPLGTPGGYRFQATLS